MSSEVEANNRSILAKPYIRYSFAVAAVAVAFVLRLVLERSFGNSSPPFLIFYPAVMLVAIVAGLWPGVLATALSSLVVDYWVLSPRGRFAIASTADAVALTLFFGMGVLISMLAESNRRNQERMAAYKSELALRQSEAQFETLTNAIPQLCWMANPDGGIFWYNQRWYEYTGTTPEQMEGWGWQSVHDPETLPKVLEQWKASIATGEPFDMVFPLRGADGVFRPFLTRVMPVKGAQGEVVRWFGTNTDITAQKQAEEDSKDSFVTLSNFVPQLVWMCTPDGLNIYFNQRWVNYTGLTLEESYGRGWNTPFHPDDQQPAWNAWNKAVQTGGQYRIECRLRAADGSYRRFLIRGEPMPDTSGGVLRWLGTCTDIEDLRQESEQLLRTVTENSRVGLVMLSNDRRYLYANAAYAEVLGLSTPDIVGKRVPDVMGHVYDQISPRLDRAFGGERVNYELKVPVRQGTGDEGRDRFYAITYEPLPDHGEGSRVIVVVVDITERKQAEEALRESEERFRLMVENVKDYALFMLDPEGRVVTWNTGAQEMKGYVADEILGEHFSRFYTPEDIATGKPQMELAIALEEGKYSEEGWRVRQDGSKFPASVTITAIHDAVGQLRCFAKITRDITERKQKEETLRSSQAKLQGIVGSAMDAIVSVDQQQRVVVFNQAAETVFQCAASEAIGSTLDRFIPESLREVHHEHIQRFGSAGVTARSMSSPGILTAVRSNGEEFPIEATISQVQADGEKLYTVILRDITERKQAEEALRQSEQQYSALFANKINAIAHCRVITDEHGQPVDYWILKINEAYERIIGIKKADIEGRRVREVFPGVENYAFDYIGVLGKVGLEGGEIMSEMFFDATGQYYSIYAYSPVPGEFTAIFTEITERKRAEAALQESEERLRLFIEHAPAALAMFDTEMRYLSVSRRWMADYGLGDRNVHGLSHYDVFPEVSDSWNAAHRRGLAGEVLGEDADRFVRADGSVQWLRWEIRPWYDKRGEVGGIVIFTVDITERKQAEQALRASEQRWATTLQSIGDAVISTDATGNIDFMNDVAQRLTGWSLAEAKGSELSAVFNIVQEVTRIKPENPVEKVIRLGKVVGLANHTALIKRDGTEIPIEDSGAPIRNREGQIEGVVLVFHDVSEQKKVEKVLRSSDRLATTGRLAATIAHEIHNPLDSVGNLLFLISQGGPEETTRQYVTMASQELVRVTQLTQQMLTFQREAAKPIPVKIGEILDSVVSLYDRKIQSAGIKLEQQVDFDGHILALPGELRQVFANLVGNAIEAVGLRHGTITLRAYASRDWRSDRPGLRVVVADDGPGIPASVRTSIFEPFFTTKGESGTGLGLWITSDILRKYDGTMRLRTSTQVPHSGTCFSIFFPFEIKP
jgi:PAS domain S-box-containing protein